MGNVRSQPTPATPTDPRYQGISRDDYFRAHPHTSPTTSDGHLQRGKSWSESYLGSSRVEPTPSGSSSAGGGAGWGLTNKSKSKSESNIKTLGRRKHKNIKSAVAKGKIIIGGPVEGT
ncbi:hypothetical protein HDV00_008585, partial [Rhizophlyctis rosea]